jgi:predicted ester cyclase
MADSGAIQERNKIPPTGHRVEFASIAMNRFHDGIVVENWGLHDIPTLLQQIQTAEHG